LHKFVSRSWLANGKVGSGLQTEGHWLSWLSYRDNNTELSIYISTLILEYFGGSIEVGGLIVVVSHSLGFIRLSSHPGCRILTPRSVWGVAVIYEIHDFMVLRSVGSLGDHVLSSVVFSAGHLYRLSSAPLAGDCCGAPLVSQETLR